MIQYYNRDGSISMIASENELYHYGVKGMKWGVRKARPQTSVSRPFGRQTAYNTRSAAKPSARSSARSGGTSGSVNNSQSVEQRRQVRIAKAKKAAKIGAAVAGTALAAYGTYKLARYMQDKRSQAAMRKAQDYVNNNIFRNVGQTNFKDGSVRFDYANKAGDQFTFKGSRNQVGKALGQHNAKTIATGRQMYKDATNTRLDKGLAKIVNTGNAVGNTTKRAATSAGNAAKRAGSTAKSAATKAKNAVLDVVNPRYEYTPGSTTTKTRTVNGVNVTERVTDYYRKKKRR